MKTVLSQLFIRRPRLFRQCSGYFRFIWGMVSFERNIVNYRCEGTHHVPSEKIRQETSQSMLEKLPIPKDLTEYEPRCTLPPF